MVALATLLTNWVDVVVLVLLFLFLVWGTARGFLLTLASLLVLVGAVLLGRAFYERLGALAHGKFGGLPPNLWAILAFLAIFLVTLFAGMALARLLRSGMEKARLLAYDRLLGAALGTCLGILILVVLFQGIAWYVGRDEEKPPERHGLLLDLFESRSAHASRWLSHHLLPFLPVEMRTKLEEEIRL